jgi:hypothetical protein
VCFARLYGGDPNKIRYFVPYSCERPHSPHVAVLTLGAVGNVLLTVLKIGVFYWLLVNIYPLSTAAFLLHNGAFITPMCRIKLKASFRVDYPLTTSPIFFLVATRDPLLREAF